MDCLHKEKSALEMDESKLFYTLVQDFIGEAITYRFFVDGHASRDDSNKLFLWRFSADGGYIEWRHLPIDKDTAGWRDWPAPPGAGNLAELVCLELEIWKTLNG